MTTSTDQTVIRTGKRGRPAVAIQLSQPVAIEAHAAGVEITTEISGPKALAGKTANLSLTAEEAIDLIQRLTAAVGYSVDVAKVANF